jgi:acetyl-CoA synthetase
VDLSRLLHPRSVAVVGATDREGTYADQTLRNLGALGFRGTVWGVHPTRESVHGRACVPTVLDLPEPVDAVVIAIPAAGVPQVIDDAGRRGCGGAVVYGAGFGEIAAGRALEAELYDAAIRHALPVCGPNGDGIVVVADRAALWGDALRPLEAGPVALVSQSGNVAVNALASRRGLRLHTVVSCGNATVVQPAAWLTALAEDESVRSVALFLEDDGDGAALAEALARCAERRVGVAVLKSGASEAGASAAAAHTGAIAGDQRVFRALVEEAGGAWAADVHELLELAKALGVRRARPRGAGLAVLTCSGGDSGLGADEAERIGVPLPPLAPATRERLRGLLPAAATVGNPLDYTAMIWGEAETLRDIVATVGADPAIDQVLVYYDHPPGLDGPPAASWAAVREGIVAGAAKSPAPTLVSSTLPELLDDGAAAGFAAHGVPAVAGLRTGIAVAAALSRPPADPAVLRRIAAAARAARPQDAAGEWLSEAEAKALLREHGVPVPDGAVAVAEREAAAVAADLGGAVALKLSGAELRHKTESGALVLGVRGDSAVRAAYRRLASQNGHAVLVERMAEPGVELLVSARADAVVPALTVGLGGIWTELLADAAVVPLPATPERVERALRSLRGAGVLTGARGRPAADVAAAARLAARAGDVLLAEGLALLELNPVIVSPSGAVAVDALARRR